MLTLVTSLLMAVPMPQSRRGGFIGEIIGWFIRVVIYDICISTIQEVLGVSRMAALFIFLGILLAGSAVAYVLRQKMAANVDDPRGGPDGL